MSDQVRKVAEFIYEPDASRPLGLEVFKHPSRNHELRITGRTGRAMVVLSPHEARDLARILMETTKEQQR